MSESRSTRRLLATCSLLLSYPDEATYDRIPLVRESLGGLPAPSADAVRRLLDWLGEVGLARAQEHYVEIFDRRRKACLYLSYFLNGDTRGRGMALVGFKQVYQEAGFTIGDGELPDFLPVVLEFGAAGDLDAALGMLGRHRAGIELLHHALDGFGSPYADVVVALLPVVPKGIEGPNAEELAASGPPTELVGLTPFIPLESLRIGART